MRAISSEHWPRISLKSVDNNGVKNCRRKVTAVYGNFGSFHSIFSNYCNKNFNLLLLWIADKLETCLLISLVFFSKKTETKMVVYAWFDQHLNSSIKIVCTVNSIKIILYGKKLLPWSTAFSSPSTAIAAIKFKPCFWSSHASYVFRLWVRGPFPRRRHISALVSSLGVYFKISCRSGHRLRYRNACTA
jgi:hypothetical protein